MIPRVLLPLSCLVALADCSWDEPNLWNSVADPYVSIPADSPLWGGARPGDSVRLLRAQGIARGSDLYDARRNEVNDPVMPAGSVLKIKSVRFFKLPVESRAYRLSLELDGYPYLMRLESRYPGQIFDAKALKEAGIAISRNSP